MPENTKGFPRPVWPKDGKNTPMPWLGDEGPQDDEWGRIEGYRAIKAEDDKLCIVCGLKLPPKNDKADNPDDYLFGLVFGEGYSERAGLGFLGEIPTPTWFHPKCGQIAALYCPHLKGAKYPAMRQNGQKLTHADLREIAKEAHAPQE